MTHNLPHTLFHDKVEATIDYTEQFHDNRDMNAIG